MDDMGEDILDSLNHLVNTADKPSKPSAGPQGKTATAKPTVQKPVDNPTAQPVFDDASTKQIIERLDGIKKAIDAIPRGPATDASPAPVEPKPAHPEPAKPRPEPAKPATPPRAQDPQPDPKPDKVKVPAENREPFIAPYVALVTAALVLVAFAFGMGYGAIVASSKFPYWYHPGLPGALDDCIAAPAGVLLLPVVAGLLALGGIELRKEGQAAAKPVFAVAGFLAVLSVLLPFMV